ncbi:MAG: hypothetical protein CMG60_03890 [Candidatus Marinimicrobia bacterium]|nr:hypothetical protein [Candidatus Neomarinimicrobiota bacterium]|tara:strand:- start:114 stop:518 length:405 start_codon:yes stop_codon:yes gene_type:complete
MNIRSDLNARTAMVYGGAAFLLMIVGFRSIFATWDPDHVGIMTYLSISALVLEFCLLLLYAQSIYNLGPDGGGGGDTSTSNSVANMDNKEISELTKAVIKVAEMGEGLSNFAKGKVQEEIRKEVNEILSKAVNK